MNRYAESNRAGTVPTRPCSLAGTVCAVSALVLCFSINAPALQAAEDTGRVGEVVPFFQVEDVEGDALDLEQLVKEHTLAITFWSSYKPMSLRAMKFLNEIYRYYQLYGLEIVAIEAEGKDSTQVREELDKLKIIGTEWTYRTVADPGKSLFRQFGVESVPEVFIVDKEGMIIFHLRGFHQGDAGLIETRIKAALELLPDSGGDASSSGGKENSKRQVVTVDPEKAIYDKYKYFGNHYFNMGDMAQALDNYRRCLSIDSEAVEIHLRVGEIYAVMKDYDKARASWETALKFDPDNREADAFIRRLIRGEY